MPAIADTTAARRDNPETFMNALAFFLSGRVKVLRDGPSTSARTTFDAPLLASPSGGGEEYEKREKESL
jgi:hypothetical protein